MDSHVSSRTDGHVSNHMDSHVSSHMDSHVSSHTDSHVSRYVAVTRGTVLVAEGHLSVIWLFRSPSQRGMVVDVWQSFSSNREVLRIRAVCSWMESIVGKEVVWQFSGWAVTNSNGLTPVVASEVYSPEKVWLQLTVHVEKDLKRSHEGIMEAKPPQLTTLPPTPRLRCRLWGVASTCSSGHWWELDSQLLRKLVHRKLSVAEILVREGDYICFSGDHEEDGEVEKEEVRERPFLSPRSKRWSLSRKHWVSLWVASFSTVLGSVSRGRGRH
eukprot:Em0507g2a